METTLLERIDIPDAIPADFEARFGAKAVRDTFQELHQMYDLEFNQFHMAAEFHGGGFRIPRMPSRRTRLKV